MKRMSFLKGIFGGAAAAVSVPVVAKVEEEFAKAGIKRGLVESVPEGLRRHFEADDDNCVSVYCEFLIPPKTFKFK